MVMVSVSLHHQQQQTENFGEKQQENAKWTGAVRHVWLFIDLS
jgi:hypothetical protein